MIALIIRCANGVVVWTRSGRPRQTVWLCEQDKFTVPVATNATTLRTTLTSIATHSISLQGAIQQIAELDV
jgi:hypothetical protein